MRNRHEVQDKSPRVLALLLSQEASKWKDRPMKPRRSRNSSRSRVTGPLTALDAGSFGDPLLKNILFKYSTSQLFGCCEGFHSYKASDKDGTITFC